MLINTTAYWAGSGGVLRINKFNHHTCKFGFVGDKLAKLAECPRVLLSPLAFPNRDSVPDTPQVLQSDTPSSAFSFFNNLLANGMVDICSKASFLLGTFLKQSLSCLGAVGLKFGSNPSMAFSKPINLSPGIDLPVRVGSYVHNAKVYTQKPVRLIRGWFRGINHNCQIKDATIENEIRLSHLPIKPRFLICPYFDRDNLSAFEGKNRNSIQSLPGEDALVIDHSRMWLEEVLRLSVRLVALRNFCYCSHGHLCRKFVVLAKMVVGEMVNVILPECAAFKGNLGCVIAGFIKSLHRLKESLMLLLVRSEFNHQGLFHTSIVECFNPQVKFKERGLSEFLCQLKQAVSFA